MQHRSFPARVGLAPRNPTRDLRGIEAPVKSLRSQETDALSRLAPAVALKPQST